MFYFYVLENEDGDLYYGATNNLRRRLSEHRSGKSASTKSGVWELVYYEAYRSESDARRRESQIKLHGQAKRQLKDRICNCRRSREQS